MRGALALAALLVVTLAPAAAGLDFRATLEPGAAPRFAAEPGANVTAELLEQGPERVAWRLRTDAPSLEGLLEVPGWFGVERARQVVPASRTAGVPDDDWHLFVVVPADALADAPRGARLANLTGGPVNPSLRLVLPVSATTGEAELELRRDARAPSFEVGAVQDVTHFSFYLETTTDEPALATVLVRPAAGGAEVPFPTTIASRLQRFPVQGLEPDAAYVFRVAFEDWAGNTAASPESRMRTLPRPVLPAPIISGRTPPPDATVAGPVGLVAVDFTGPAPRGLDGVRAFVDKTAVFPEDITLLPGRVEVRVAPALGPGKHSVGFDLTSAEGGTVEDSWSFTVAGATPAPWAALAALVVAAVGLAVRPRRP